MEVDFQNLVAPVDVTVQMKLYGYHGVTVHLSLVTSVVDMMIVLRMCTIRLIASFPLETWWVMTMTISIGVTIHLPLVWI